MLSVILTVDSSTVEHYDYIVRVVVGEKPKTPITEKRGSRENR
jgi:hypothetical protein